MSRTWSQKLAINVPAIDAQHKELFRRSDELLAAMRGGKGPDEVKKLLAYLEQYVTVHFGAEEKLMASMRYPELATHKQMHQEFKQEFQAIKDQVAKSATGSAATLRLNSLMGTWLVHHIGSVDSKLAGFLGAGAASVQL